MNTSTELAALLASDISLIFDVATRFNCGEIDTVTRFLTEHDETAAAQCWLDAHATEDDEGDSHHELGQRINHQIDTTGYVWPTGD